MKKADNKITSPEKIPTMIHLDEDDLPEIKKWQVGNTYKIVLEVKQTSSSMDEYEGDKARAGFKILKANAVDSSADTKDFKEFESEYSNK